MLGFNVIKWGLTTHDAHLQTDTVPAGFQIERKLHLEHAHDPPRIIVEQPEPAHPERDAFLIKFQRPATKLSTVVFQTRFNNTSGRLQYAVKEGKASTFADDDWCSSSTQAFNSFRERNNYKSSRTASGPVLFGIRCDHVQSELAALRATLAPPYAQDKTKEMASVPKISKTSNAMSRVPVKTVSKKVLQEAKQSPSPSASPAPVESKVYSLTCCAKFIMSVFSKL